MTEATVASPATSVTSPTQDRIAAANIESFQWGTVAYFIGITACYVGTIALAVGGTVPYWAACLINGWLGFCFYMPFHEACHRNIYGTHPRLTWLNESIGWLASLPLTIPFRTHREMHALHHAYLNNPDLDPDVDVKGTLWDVSRRWAQHTLMGLLPVMPKVADAARPKWTELPRIGEALRHGLLVRRVQLAVLAAGIATGYGAEVVLLWYVPARLAMLYLMVVFQWIPHHPHDSEAPYQSTRTTFFPGSAILMMGEDVHIIHHLYPRVPFYRIRRVFRGMRAELDAHNIRIDRGFRQVLSAR